LSLEELDTFRNPLTTSGDKLKSRSHGHSAAGHMISSSGIDSAPSSLYHGSRAIKNIIIVIYVCCEYAELQMTKLNIRREVAETV
jgi:hypothetical protein